MWESSSKQEERLIFQKFFKKIYPRLEQLMHAKQSSKHMLGEDLIRINMEILSELYCIAENMQAYSACLLSKGQVYAHNAFFDACDDFVDRFDQIECIYSGIGNGEAFFELLHADEVISKWVDALKQTLLETGDDEALKRVEKRNNACLSWQYDLSIPREEGSSSDDGFLLGEGAVEFDESREIKRSRYGT